MVWFKVDDTLAFHHKAVAAGNAALGLWVRAGSWSSQQLTSGFIPSPVVRAMGTERQAQRLVAAGLWVEAEGGYQFHDWKERNPTAEEVHQKRKTTVKRVSDWRNRCKNPDQVIPETPSSEPGVTRYDGVTPPPVTRYTGSGRVTVVSKGEGSKSLEVDHPADGLFDVPPPSGNGHKPKAEPPGFAAFWDAYPRKTGKEAARKAWAAAVKRGAKPADITSAARVYASSATRDPQFTPHPATWLNQGRYEDGPAEQPDTSEWWDRP